MKKEICLTLLLILFSACSADMVNSSIPCSQKNDSDENLSVFKGDYTIESINDINKLQGYYAITGDLLIKSNLKSLAGLESIRSVLGALIISENTEMTSLAALKNIDYVGAGIEIFQNPALTSLEGLESISVVLKHLIIGENDSLTSLKGLDQVVSVTGPLLIVDNKSLVSLEGLGKLDSVGESLLIQRNEMLQASLAKAFGERVSVGDSTIIEDNKEF